MKKVYHLSHTDLDGYSCQIITNEIFENINFYNSNYGKEINNRIEQILTDIEKDGFEENLILITDLNLTLEQAKFLEERAKSSNFNIELLLLDHHKTGKDCADKYLWYYLDVTRSATKITFDYFYENYKNIKYLEKYVDTVNAVDIWLSGNKYFELGKVCMKLVSSSREINRILFPLVNTKYIFHLLTEARKIFEEENPHIALDDHIHFLKKSFFLQSKENNTLDNLVSNYMVSLLSEKKEDMTVTYKEYKGLLAYGIGNVSIIGNGFLVKNPEFDFFINVSGNKKIGMRSNDKADVSQIAKELFGGGGHANASGGMLNNFKDTFVYDNIRVQIQELMNKGVENGNKTK